MTDEVSTLVRQVEQLIDKYQKIQQQLQTLSEKNADLAKKCEQQSAKIASTKVSISKLINNINAKLENA